MFLKICFTMLSFLMPHVYGAERISYVRIGSWIAYEKVTQKIITCVTRNELGNYKCWVNNNGSDCDSDIFVPEKEAIKTFFLFEAEYKKQEANKESLKRRVEKQKSFMQMLRGACKCCARKKE